MATIKYYNFSSAADERNFYFAHIKPNKVTCCTSYKWFRDTKYTYTYYCSGNLVSFPETIVSQEDKLRYMKNINFL